MAAGVPLPPRYSRRPSCMISNGRSCCRVIVAPTANRRLVGTWIATVLEAASGILSGDAVERGSQRLFKGFNSTRADPAQIGFHLSPDGFDRAEVRAVGGQIAIRKA